MLKELAKMLKLIAISFAFPVSAQQTDGVLKENALFQFSQKNATFCIDFFASQTPLTVPLYCANTGLNCSD
jgi:hypothetical protein